MTPGRFRTRVPSNVHVPHHRELVAFELVDCDTVDSGCNGELMTTPSREYPACPRSKYSLSSTNDKMTNWFTEWLSTHADR